MEVVATLCTVGVSVESRNSVEQTTGGQTETVKSVVIEQETYFLFWEPSVNPALNVVVITIDLKTGMKYFHFSFVPLKDSFRSSL